MTRIRLMIVDDHSIVRQGLRALVRTLPDMELVGEATNGGEARALVAECQPHVVLMDLVMPEVGGVSAIAAIKRDFPQVRVIALTTFAEPKLVQGAVQAGVDGYLLKDVDIRELARAIRSVHAGMPYLHAEATRLLLQSAAGNPAPVDRLTDREQEVLALLAKGMSNRQIADALSISEKTVSVHVSNLLSKLGLESRTQAALYAASSGIIAPSA